MYCQRISTRTRTLLVEQYQCVIWFEKRKSRKKAHDYWQYASPCKYPWYYHIYHILVNFSIPKILKIIIIILYLNLVFIPLGSRILHWGKTIFKQGFAWRMVTIFSVFGLNIIYMTIFTLFPSFFNRFLYFIIYWVI